MTVQQFNSLSEQSVRDALFNCCTSISWVERMVVARPFSSQPDLLIKASQHWQNLAESDYLQAFEGHPKIGDVDSLREKYAATKAMAGGEQSGVNSASDDVVRQLSDGNAAYEAKFGFIFIVCATGKSAAKMLALLEARLSNSRSKELINAAGEQEKITAIRLQKLVLES